MERCLLIGFVVGLCAGSLVLAWEIGVIFAGIEALLCFLISAVCFSALAILDALKRGLAPEPPSIIVKPRREDRY